MKKLSSKVNSNGPKKKQPKNKPHPRKNDSQSFSNTSMDYDSVPQDTEKWYSTLPSEPEEFSACPESICKQLHQEARQMLDSEANGYNIRASKNSEQSWMRTVMSKGTGKDKIAAFTLMVQEKPLYNINALSSLVGLVKPGKKESVACIDTLVELFVTELLPPGKKLRVFSQHPLVLLDELSSGNPAGRRRRLIAWYFEDQLKAVYKEFVDSLKIIAGEAVEANKEKAIKALAQLLESHPEQEAVLLSYLVNKMGDPSKKVSSKAMHCLIQVLSKHPNMKGVIIDEIEKLLFRPNIGSKARYYGICFLSQIMFRKNDSQLAANLIKIYFSFFKACVKLGDVDSRMLSVLLTGVNRAYPYAREAMDSISDQLETLYKVVHLAPFHVSLQGLSLLFQVSDFKNFVSDRFYSVLYRKLLDPSLLVTSHSGMFLNLIYQALSKDSSVPRVRTFVKRLLQVCCYMTVPMKCGTLYTISQIVNKRAALAAPKGELTVKEETENSEVKSEKSNPLPAGFMEEDSGDEHYEDAPLSEDEAPKNGKAGSTQEGSNNENGKTKQPVAWVHKTIGKKFKTDAFDPTQRNPLYANGELCSYFELCLLSQHFHPTVALFASQILNNELIKYSGDPLQDFTQIRFLERFSFKNPKKLQEPSSSSHFAKRQNYSVSGLRSMPLTSHAYISQEEGKIPVDERYLFRYLQQRRNAADIQKAEEGDGDSDVESVGSVEFEEMLEDIMKKRGFKKDMDDDDDDDDQEADIDFDHEFSKTLSSKKSKKRVTEEVDEMDDDDEEAHDSDDELDDEEEDFDADGGSDVDSIDLDGKEDSGMNEDEDDDEGEEDFNFDDLDDDAEDMDFDDDSADENSAQGPSKGKNKNKKKGFDSNVFASAEEFSELLEAAGAAREGSSAAFSNKDKASLKQLNWEAERDRWVKGFNNFTKGGGKASTMKKGKSMKKKNPSFKAKKKR